MDNKQSGLELIQLDQPAYHPGLLMGIDFGLKRIGIAVGQGLIQTAQPLSILPNLQRPCPWPSLSALIKEWAPEAFVVGIPLNMDDSPQPMTHKARAFAQSLRCYQRPVYGVDERLTSREARAILHERGGYRAIEKTGVDALAATLILEQWFSLCLFLKLRTDAF